ncbi:MAG: hypothetical protein E4H33_04355 [Anaerolineales bacterium]|nr:MAG: hypothetical protein E4H33_04355 [Anaerolineales bacterium]
MTTENAILSPAAPVKKGGKCFLWGCLIIVLLVLVTICCLGTLFFLPFFTDFDPLGFDFRNRIEEFIPLQELLGDTSLIPGLPDIMDEDFDPYLEEGSEIVDPTQGTSTSDLPSVEALSIPLDTYTGSDFPATFSYPAGWDIEVEEGGVTFYDPNSYTYLFVGEYFVENGMTAQEISRDMNISLNDEAQEGTFQILERAPYTVPTGDDAYLSAYEWTSLDGYFTWAFDLETVQGESNIYFFLSGEDPETAALYGELIEIIAASFSR